MAERYGTLKLKGMIFGDDETATVVHERSPRRDRKTGIILKQYLIIPSDHMKAVYPKLQDPTIVNVPTGFGENAIWVEYPVKWVHDENPSRTNAWVRIDCSFNLQQTPETRRHEKYTEEIDNLQRENERLRIMNMTLNEELKVMSSDLKERINEIRACSDILEEKKSNKSEDEDEYQG
jgi:hypothetical protein